MRLLSKIFAWVLLALWLPVTLHCTLEAAGVIATQCPGACGHNEGPSDNCAAVESGLYKNAGSNLKAPAPVLLTVAFRCEIPRLPSPETPSVFLPEFVSAPQTLGRTWQFVERAAPPSRAPATLV